MEIESNLVYLILYLKMRLSRFKLSVIYWLFTLPHLALILMAILLENKIVLFAFSIPLGFFLSYFVYKKSVIQPLDHILQASEAMSQGDLTVRIETTHHTELGLLGNSLNRILENQSRLYEFALQLGEGNYKSEYKVSSERDQLGFALTHMRDQLQKVSLADKSRSWANEGIAKFSEILRANDKPLKQLSDEFISQLVKYMKANQGAVFALEEGEEKLLKMVSCYAWERKKFQEKTLHIGQGLVGQAAIEKSTLYLTHIPNEYTQITSGLGGANPKSILIVPLLSNDEVHGVIELASFNEFDANEISFVEKLAENFGSTLATSRVNAHTQYLLDESRKMTEHLRSQEEALRQNAEELNATHESLQEKLREAKEEMLAQIKVIENERKKNLAVLEGCVDGIMVFNKNGKIEFVNKAAEEIWGFHKEDVLDKEIQKFIPIQIEQLHTGYMASYVNGYKREIDVRTEITAHNFQGEEMSVLLTLTKAMIEEEPTFTIFTQKISVELF